MNFIKKLTPFLLVSLLVGFLAPADLHADGGFVVSEFVWDKHKDINEPTQKAILVYDNGHEDLILQVKYEGPVDEFGWLIPVPNLPTVKEGSMKCFYELSQYTQKQFEWGHQYSQPMSAAMTEGAASSGIESEPPVKVIEIKTIGAYEIAVLSTRDSGALEKWLGTNHFYFPTNKTDVLDAYVKQQWYFIAVKVKLRQGLLGLISSRSKLASGELNPLQISFASDRCVFPLKISSINGRPSEVQVYVLSSEPLLERTLLEKKLPLINSNAVARAAQMARLQEEYLLMQKNPALRIGGTILSNSSLSAEDEKGVKQISETLFTAPGELLPYAGVTRADLPDCSKWIPRLADKSWWLTKQTWMFKPEEMRDLKFEPAWSFFAEQLGTKYGFFAADSLISFGSDAVPTIIAAMQSTNPTARITAAGTFSGGCWGYVPFGYRGTIRDSRFTEAALTWLKDSEPSVRHAGVQMLTDYSNWNPKNAEPLVALLRDEDSAVRHAVVFGLLRFRGPGEIEQYVPAFQQLLKDKNPGIQWAGLEMLRSLQVQVPRADLLPFFKSSDEEILIAAFGLLKDRHEKISDGDALSLLQNPEPVARFLGLEVLDQNPGKQSIELALPLLKDPDALVRLRTAHTLRTLTGEDFTADQTGEWVKWWSEHKANFVMQPSPNAGNPTR